VLVDGKWMENWQPVQKVDEKGRFVRQVSSFRNWVTPDGSAGPMVGETPSRHPTSTLGVIKQS